MIYDICIIGAGVIGCGIARELSRYDLRILLLERDNDVAQGATKANSGILHGGYDAKHGTLKARFAYRGNQLYTQWDRDLRFGIERTGSLVLAFTDAETQVLHELQHNSQLNGVPVPRIIDRTELLEMEPRINPEAVAALHCAHSGIVSPYEVTLALAENAMQNGVDCILEAPVQELQYENGTQGLWNIASSTANYRAKILINASGLYSDTIAELTGINRYRISPRKGNYYVFRHGYLPLTRVVFQAPSKKGKGVLVSPTLHGNMIIGPDAQDIHSKEDKIPDKTGLDYIEKRARLTLPDLDMSMALRSYAGIRSSLSSSKDFAIDKSVKNCIQLIGIDSPGLTAAPSIAEHIVQETARLLTLVQRPDFIASRSPYTVRQKEKTFLPMKKVLELAKREPGDPERMVCQCEQVQEKTIQEALRRRPCPSSIAAIKRRTRAGMGYCQGKICRPRVRQILATALNATEGEIKEY